jgi:hypothetical protein
MSRTKRAESGQKKSGDRRLYSLQVLLSGGPVTEEFAERNPVVSRTIQIRGDQTLETLHDAIFEAFDREEEHLYEFQRGNRPHDPKAQRYVMPMEFDSSVPRLSSLFSRGPKYRYS